MIVPGSKVVVKSGDSFDHWLQVTCRDFSRTDCHRVADQEFRAQITTRNFGDLIINNTWSSPRLHVTRSPDDIRKDPRDYFMLWLGLTGETIFSQQDREVPIRPGDLVLHDQGQAFTLAFAEQSRSIMISIPRPLLTSRLHNAADMVSQRVARQSKLGGLAGSIVRQLARLDATKADDTARRLGASALDIFTTALETLADDDEPRHDRERVARVKKYILANLRDSKMNLDTMALAQNMAPRTLSRLFAREGTTPIRWLWQQRLAASYKALAEGRINQVTDAALTFGFSDLSHFSHAFKMAFGRTPQDVKRGRGY
jgi:AraC-like DNA-binding protein